MYLLHERKLANSGVHNLHVVAKVINFCQFFFLQILPLKFWLFFFGGGGASAGNKTILRVWVFSTCFACRLVKFILCCKYKTLQEFFCFK